MKTQVLAPLMASALLTLPSCDQVSAGQQVDDNGLTGPYFAMRDAQICAGLDPRTDVGEYQREELRTAAILQLARRNGLSDAINAAAKHWVETDGYGDKICPFQVGELDETTHSIELYRAANDELEAAIAAEAK